MRRRGRVPDHRSALGQCRRGHRTGSSRRPWCWPSRTHPTATLRKPWRSRSRWHSRSSPSIARVHDDGEPAIVGALSIPADAPVERLIARLSSALRLRALHATVLRRAKTLKSERNIVAELPPEDPIEDATVLVIGRGRSHPVLTVAVGERMGVMGALSVDAAARCLNAREIEGIAIGDGLPARTLDAFLTVLAEDVALSRSADRSARPRLCSRRSAELPARDRSGGADRAHAAAGAAARLRRPAQAPGSFDRAQGHARRAYRSAQHRRLRPRPDPRHRRGRRARRRPVDRALLVRGRRPTAAAAWTPPA